MAELAKMTVKALRDLARKALGRGYSKLKTKAQLVEALEAAEKRIAGSAGETAAEGKGAAAGSARARGKGVGTAKAKRGAAAEKPPEPGAVRGKPVEKDEAAGASGRSKVGQATPAAARAKVAAAAKAGASRVRAAARGEPEPDPEGYMVARVAGEEAVRVAPRPMTESALEARRSPPAYRGPAREPRAWPDGYDEQLGELPFTYGDDVLVALPRDPRTLFVYWDHAQETIRQAFQGLDGGRAQLWIFARAGDGGWGRVRAVDVALESRSYYLHDLEPSAAYRAELHVVDRRGADRILARPSNEATLPHVGPAALVDDRFLRILWGEPLQRLLREPHPGAPFSDEARAQLARLSDWSRFAGRAWGGSAGGMGGRPSSPTSSPSAPSSPSSPWGGTGGEWP